MKKRKHPCQISKSMVSGMIFLAFFFTLAGCAANYGHIQLSLEASRSFENYEVLDDHTYYYSGPESIPHAIIAIHQDYTLKSNLWKPIHPSAKQLKTWFDLGMDGSLSWPPLSSIIYGPEGQKIGIWYSFFRGTVVRLEKDNQVVVHPPISGPCKNFVPLMQRGSVESSEPIASAG